MMEVWKDVVGYEGLYFVSSLGRIKNASGKILKQTPIDGRYLRVSLWKDGKQKTGKVHHIVATAFIGPRPDGMECCHNDGNIINNFDMNLRWDTPQGNQADRKLHGTSSAGSANGRAKIDGTAAGEIRQAISEGASLSVLARLYGISKMQVARIRDGQAWA